MSDTQGFTIIINGPDEQITLKNLKSESLKSKIHYFQGLFSFNENVNTCHELEFDFPEQLETIVNYFIRPVHPDCIISFSNVVQLMYTSTYFQCEEFFRLCIEFLLKNLQHLPVSFKKDLISEILLHHDLFLSISEIYPLITEFFLSKGLTEETGNLPVGLITSILKSDQLQVKNENEVANFISNYLAKNTNQKLTDELFACIRFKTQTFDAKQFFNSKPGRFLEQQMSDIQREMIAQDFDFISKNLDFFMTEDVHFLRPGSLGFLLLVSDDRIDIWSKADNSGLGSWFQYKNLNENLGKICQGNVEYDMEKSVITWRGGVDVQKDEVNNGVIELNLLTGELNKKEDNSVFTNSAEIKVGENVFNFGGFLSNDVNSKCKFSEFKNKLYPAACNLQNGKILVCGGLDNKTCLSDGKSFTFDVETKQFQQIEDMNINRHKHKLVLVEDKVFCIGGSLSDEQSKEQPLSSCEYYCLKSKKWFNIESMNRERKHAGVAQVLNTICVVGGLDLATGHTNINMEVYVIEENKWFMVEGSGSELKGGPRRFPNLFWIPPGKLDSKILEEAKEYSNKLGEELELTTQQMFDLWF